MKVDLAMQPKCEFDQNGSHYKLSTTGLDASELQA